MDLNEKKELLKQAWKEVFDVNEVADDADFFDEGGDSIKAVELSSWLIQKGIKLDLGKIFYTSVLADMAESLEETQPMYVPEKLMTKELFKEKYDAVMSGKPVPEDHPEEEDQQICDPNLTGPGVEAQNPPIAAPNMATAGGLDGEDQQICDPNLTGTGVDAQNPPFRIPNMPAVGGPDAEDQQICDPNLTGTAPVAGQNLVVKMLKLMITQQQTVLQMMELMADIFAGPAPMRAPALPVGNFMPNALMQTVPADKQAALKKVMSQFYVKKADAPIEKPNVIKIEKAKVAKPTKSAEEVLEYVLKGLLKNGLDKSMDLFEQGLTSLDAVKLVTRCGEHGYAVKMQDIFMHSKFEELVKCMVPGK
jgi:aryl carrier-like protein